VMDLTHISLYDAFCAIAKILKVAPHLQGYLVN